ncbi:hypothetical protein THAOC_01486 [Thalassiosira oceanica]|uniref:Lon N-terminal domain-containing protein n=1 Tax=Thalassiosira oceanica TaxID=159749 RepID=K0TN18_THAOC|nr:hypothetical protein THAOC_01486 [Thalassiosira oceanica]|eukprot:EJK76736.1 hypothetical protein THAOC_01486 [Thalassiosira oceanica]
MTNILVAVAFCASASAASAFVPTSSKLTNADTLSHGSTRRGTSRRHRSLRSLRMVDEDDDGNPLARGVDSVSWLPSVYSADPSKSVFDAATSEDEEDNSETLPLFPLGGVVYTPNSEHILNIFEPRYRQMYNDILINGSKRFVVSMSHPSEEGRFAQVGVLFSLEELKEVSEMTADQVKYICNHRVTGRVKLHKVLNPEQWEKRETYLKVKGTIIDDTGFLSKKIEDNDREDDETGMDEQISKKLVSSVKKAAAADMIEKSPDEAELERAFIDVVDFQHDLSEDVRFTRASARSFGVAEGTDVDPNLWTSIRLWQSYAEQRLVANQNEMQKEFQERLVDYLKKDMGKEGDEELPSAIGFQDLSPELQKELIDLQKRMTAELKPLLMEQTLSMQKILEAEDHKGRVDLMLYFVNAERKRLQAKKTLKSMFGGSPTAVAEREIAEPEPPTLPKLDDPSQKQQLFNDDDDDSWQ